MCCHAQFEPTTVNAAELIAHQLAGTELPQYSLGCMPSVLTQLHNVKNCIMVKFDPPSGKHKSIAMLLHLSCTCRMCHASSSCN
jgi:hypothetical protein